MLLSLMGQTTCALLAAPVQGDPTLIYTCLILSGGAKKCDVLFIFVVTKDLLAWKHGLQIVYK